MGVEGEWATKKADAVVGSLGHSKMEEESNHKHFSFLLLQAATRHPNSGEKLFIVLLSAVCGFFFFLTGSVKPGTTQWDDCIPLNG